MLRYFPTALVATVVMVVVEHVHFLTTRARGFLYGTAEHFLFGVHGLALAILAAAALASLAWAASVVERHTARVGLFRSPRLGAAVQGVCLMALAVALACSRGGAAVSLPPVHHLGMVLLLPAAFVICAFLVLRWLEPTGVEIGARYNLCAIASLLVTGWFLIASNTPDDIRAGIFGLDDRKHAMRTLVTLGAPIGVMSLAAFLALRTALGRVGRGVSYFGSAALLPLIHHANATLFVDSYRHIHTLLVLTSLLLAWHLASAIDLRMPGSWKTRPRVPLVIATAAIVGAVAVVAAVRVESNLTYVSGVYTVNRRYALELLQAAWTRTPRCVRQTSDAASGLPPTFREFDRHHKLDAPVPTGVILFFVDAKRPRDMGAYGTGKSRTPNIDECFDDAFVFERAFSAGTSTEVAFPTIYSATYAGTRRQTRYETTTQSPWHDYQTGTNNLVETFRSNGFRAILATNSWYWRGFFTVEALEPIFGRFDEVVREKKTAGTGTERLLAAYEERGSVIPPSNPFLLVVHLVSHSLAELPEVDNFIGAVCDDLRRSGRREDTLLLLTADHGVQYGEHGRYSYGRTLFNEELLVPLLVRVPGLPGTVVTDNVSSVDHLPTLVELLGLEADYLTEGHSYAPALRGLPLARDRAIFFETRMPTWPSVGVVSGDAKLLHWPASGAHALFLLDEDPGETRNQFATAEHAAASGLVCRYLSEFMSDRSE